MIALVTTLRLAADVQIDRPVDAVRAFFAEPDNLGPAALGRGAALVTKRYESEALERVNGVLRLDGRSACAFEALARRPI